MSKIVGLVGYPVSHSISPQMHNAAFKELELDYTYQLFEIKPEKLKEFVESMRTQNIAGVNVTIPHKEAVIPLLSEISKEAKLIGAVNTILNQNGRLIGFNTDGAGFIESLKSDGGVDPKGKKVVLLGAGGGAKAVAVTLCQAGIKSLAVTDILPERSSLLVKQLESNFKLEILAHPVDCPGLKAAIEKGDILINATPVGMHPKTDENPLKVKAKIPSSALVCDLIYNPPETRFLKEAKAQGCRTLNGLGMLVRQGALAFKIWTGQEPPIEVMRQAARTALAH